MTLSVVSSLSYPESDCRQFLSKLKQQCEEIDGCNDNLSEKQIRLWIEQYGEVLSQLKEEAGVDLTDNSMVGE
jgi:hypothetical protein